MLNTDTQIQLNEASTEDHSVHGELLPTFSGLNLTIYQRGSLYMCFSSSFHLLLFLQSHQAKHLLTLPSIILLSNCYIDFSIFYVLGIWCFFWTVNASIIIFSVFLLYFSNSISLWYISVSIPGSGRSLGEGNGNPLQYSCKGNPMDRGAWWATVHGVTKELHTTERLNNNMIYHNYSGRECKEPYKIK